MKICCHCKTEKDISEFYMRSDRKKPGSRCKICHALYYRDYYAKKPRRRKNVREHADRLRARNKSIVLEAKKTGCVDCGIKDPRVLDFDHLRDKEHNVSHLVSGMRSVKMLETEIAKCEVVCANCHRIRTHERRKAKNS